MSIKEGGIGDIQRVLELCIVCIYSFVDMVQNFRRTDGKGSCGSIHSKPVPLFQSTKTFSKKNISLIFNLVQLLYIILLLHKNRCSTKIRRVKAE